MTADSLMAIFGFRRIATQSGNVISPVAFHYCHHCDEQHEDGSIFCDICGDHHEPDAVPLVCETGDGV